MAPMRGAAGALILLLVAGCASTSNEGNDATTPASTTTPSEAGPAPAPLTVVVPLTWDGATVAGVWLCDTVAGQGCVFQPSAQAYGVTHDWPLLGGNLTGGNVTLTWTAASQVTRVLTLGVQRLNGSCDECGWAAFAPEVTGASPLTFPVPGGLQTGPDDQVRVWVYVPIYQAAGPEYVGGSVPQDFRVSGALNFLVDAAKAPRMH